MQKIAVEKLVPGMITAEDVLTYNDQLILPKGLELTDKSITKLTFYAIISVYVEDYPQELIDEATATVEQPVVTDIVQASEQQPFQSKEESVDVSLSAKIKSSPEFQEYKENFDNEVHKFKNSIQNLIEKNVPIDTNALLEQVMGLLDSGSTTYSVFDMLNNMRKNNDATYAHSMNVALICNIFGGWLNLSASNIKTLTMCALLHDIGKVKIPAYILSKPTVLSEDEYKVIKTHTVEGYRMVKDANLDDHIKNTILMHHEKCDGSGYPLGLIGNKIEPYAQIVAIADVYDAMTSARIYRGPLCPFQVIAQFESEGLRKFKPEYLLTFMENVVNTYVKNRVRLSNGLEGDIIFINKAHLSRPMIKCGSKYIDLSTEHSLYIDSIL